MKIQLDKKQGSRYFAPKKAKDIHHKFLKYKNAEALANDINFNENDRFFVIVDGTFYFGDFIEAFIVKHNIKVKKMTISSLSLNQNNIDSLANLLNGSFVDELNLIVSDYFYQNEKFNLMPYIYQNLDVDNKFQLASASIHTKICIFETYNGRKFVFHGSANLRSSSNVEQIMLEESKDLYDFNNEFHHNIIETYKTINKSVRRKNLWQAVTKVGLMEAEKNKGLHHGEVQKQGEEIHNMQQQKVQVLRSNKIKF